MYNNRVILITGGTGSFGNAAVMRFLNTDALEIRIFSRDEKKQDDMRRKYNNRRLKFFIGDVRQRESVDFAMKDVDYVFHAAALKQVPTCEFFPMEAVKTNILGTENVLDSAIAHGVKRVVCLSTDKAAYPINAMGTSKAMMEKVIIAKSRYVNEDETTITLTRYGNVMASRGSVIPLFHKLISEKKPLTITNPDMTRFMMTLDEAVELVVYAFRHANQGDLFIQKAPAATIGTLAESIRELMQGDVDTKIIGERHGEKLYEVLVTREEMAKAQDLGDFFRIPADQRDLNYDKYFDQGELNKEELNEYNSHNTYRLDKEETKQLLKKLDLFREYR